LTQQDSRDSLCEERTKVRVKAAQNITVAGQTRRERQDLTSRVTRNHMPKPSATTMIQELIMGHHTPSHSGRMVVPEIFFIQIWYITYRKIATYQKELSHPVFRRKAGWHSAQCAPDSPSSTFRHQHHKHISHQPFNSRDEYMEVPKASIFIIIMPCPRAHGGF